MNEHRMFIVNTFCTFFGAYATIFWEYIMSSCIECISVETEKQEFAVFPVFRMHRVFNLNHIYLDLNDYLFLIFIRSHSIKGKWKNLSSFHSALREQNNDAENILRFET